MLTSDRRADTQAPNASIDPRPAKSKVTVPPATTGTGAVTPPEKISCPRLLARLFRSAALNPLLGRCF
jgi:hypothetical protein